MPAPRLPPLRQRARRTRLQPLSSAQPLPAPAALTRMPSVPSPSDADNEVAHSLAHALSTTTRSPAASSSSSSPDAAALLEPLPARLTLPTLSAADQRQLQASALWPDSRSPSGLPDLTRLSEGDEVPALTGSQRAEVGHIVEDALVAALRVIVDAAILSTLGRWRAQPVLANSLPAFHVRLAIGSLHHPVILSSIFLKV